MLFGQEHVERYVATDGAEGHDWQGTQTLILTTTGRKSGQPRSTPLIYGQDGDDYVLVASKGGDDEDPLWYRNLTDDPAVQIQVKADRLRATARTATPQERERLWPLMTGHWPAYDDYAKQTDREIPVVVVSPN